jgi:lactoylglutathione lyase
MLEVNLVVLRSPQIDRAVAFYQTLGLTLIKHSHGQGPEHYSSEIAGCVFELYPLTSGQTPTTSIRLGFRVDELDELVSRLAAIGAIILSPPQDSPWGKRAIVQDLDGHTIELNT